MAVYAITFSPVGGTRKAAGFFLKGFCSDGIPIDLTDRALAFSDMAFTARDICLVAVPAYGGRVPRPAAERLGQMHGGGVRAILMAVYGNRAFEDTLAELAGLLCAAGFRCTAGVAAVAQHSKGRDPLAGLSAANPFAAGFAGPCTPPENCCSCTEISHSSEGLASRRQKK